MNVEIRKLLNEFKKSLRPVKKDIFSIVIHGSSVYSDDLKPFQDIDTYVIFKKQDYKVLEKFRETVKTFCVKHSSKETIVQYSVAGAGRGGISKSHIKNKQIFSFEIYVDNRYSFEIGWKKNLSLPLAMVKNYKVLMGEDVGNYVQYVGGLENKKVLLKAFDLFQWTIATAFENDFDSVFLNSSVQDGVFSDVISFFLNGNILEKRKNYVLHILKDKFPHLYKNHKILLKNVKTLREEGASKLSSEKLFHLYVKFHNSIWRKIDGRN